MQIASPGRGFNVCPILLKVTAVVGNISFHKENEGAYDGNSRQSCSQLIILMELCMSLKLFSK